MNRTALKNYAPKARLDFIRAITDRAAFFGLAPDRTEPMHETGDVVIIGGRAFPRAVAAQRKTLQERIAQHGFDQVMEAMAYTWFNRFVALRYMELHGYLDHGYRVLSHPEGKATPEIVEHAEHVTLPGLDAQQVINLKLDGTREADLYRVLLVAQCNALNEAMPFLFEKIADDTELLLPDNLLHSDSVIRNLVNEIEEADWQQVEIIGWLYQFYIADKKDEVIGSVVKSEDIPAATQLFTPNWIVKYLVQNTLGRQWLATYPDSPLRQQMEYYIEPAEQAEEVKAQLAAITPKSLDPETLTLLDPACGSGHILVEAYDLFKAIYQERGYRSKDIPRLVLEKNLFGLEIDDRAAQLAAFALLMKARADDRRIFADRIQPHVLAIQDSKGLESLLTPHPAAAAAASDLPFTDSDLFPDTQKQLALAKSAKDGPLAAVEPCLRELIRLFEHGKTFGSLIRVPSELAAHLPVARQRIEAMIANGQLWEHRAANLLLPLVNQAELLSNQYEAVAANPPYMGSKFMNSTLKTFVKSLSASSRTDTFAVFMERCLDFAVPRGRVGLVTPFVWMFISTYERLRQRLVSMHSIVSLIQLEYNAFEPACVPVCTFILGKMPCPMLKGSYIKLSQFRGSENQPLRTLEAIQNPNCGWFFAAITSDFAKIPGAPISYWFTEETYEAFQQGLPLSKIASPRQGLATTDNGRFVRQWWEVDMRRIGFGLGGKEAAARSGGRWFPYNKGGDYRRWFGNAGPVVNWQHDGAEIKAEIVRKYPYLNGNPDFVAKNQDCYFHESASWSKISNISFALRYYPPGFVFDVAGCSLFSTTPGALAFILGLLNSKLSGPFLTQIAPTMNFEVGQVATVPILKNWARYVTPVSAIVTECIHISRIDWNASERSWDFEKTPLIGLESRLELALARWDQECRNRLARLKTLEEENNRLFIEAYGLTRMSSTVLETDIALYRSEREEDMRRLVSYAIGCMMGRYSLDAPGLIYAHNGNEGFDPSRYPTFPADADGIIPITDIAWFPDDAAERFVEFIAKAWPREHQEENLKFIADSLGPNRDEHPRDTIRRYLATGFYKAHLQTYKKRPIYWLFSSGKQRAFQCLVYLHRYHEGTLARMRTEYVIPLQGKIAHRIEQLAGDITAATSTSHRRKLEKERETLVKQHTELVAFDEKLRHYADQRIALDLDDGVKVNYGKFGDLLAEVKAVTGGSEE
jgi:SAM-dependent methyltransferase